MIGNSKFSKLTISLERLKVVSNMQLMGNRTYLNLLVAQETYEQSIKKTSIILQCLFHKVIEELWIYFGQNGIDIMCRVVNVHYNQPYLQIFYRLKMGLQCIKAVQERGHSSISLRRDGLEGDLRHSRDIVSFYIKINNLRLLDFSQTFHNILIQVQGYFSVLISEKEFQKQERVWTSSSYWTAQLEIPINQISNKIVSISILDRHSNVLDSLNIKLYHLSIGPIKHDHLLKSLKSRLLFDFHVDQYLSFEVFLNDFQIVWKKPQNYSEYSYFMSLIFSNTKNHIEATKKYEKHQKIKGWGLEKIKVRNSDLFQSIIKLKMAKTGSGQNQIEYFVPYSKFMQQNTYKQISNEFGSFQERQLTLNQQLIIRGENVGSIKLILGITKSKLYAQQMDCVIFSQHGIVMATPTDFLDEEKELTGQVIFNFHAKLRTETSFGISDHQFLKMMQSVYVVLKQREFSITDDLFKTQEILLDFMLQLAGFIDQDRVLRNEYVWKILHQILHKKIMSLKYFGSIRDQASKKKYAFKIYKLMIVTIVKIINLIDNGISFKQLSYIQRFIAYAYFRCSWCQSKIVEALQRPTDPVISEDKLGEIGASYAMKSPSKSYFYDFSSNVLKYIQRDQDYLKLMKNLQQFNEKNPKWASLLFDRQYEQLFYGLYSELWDQAELFLKNNGKIMWQYFPKYDVLLSIFLGEMNSNSLSDFSDQMTRCNMKLIKNEKLLNTFITLIFPKTCLYETYCVLKCLDLINCYFSVILKNNEKLPIDFNYTFFYSGIRCILQSHHSMLLQKMLAMIYKYYKIFNKDFKEALNHYINCRVFNRLFMHWSQNVRNIFHFLLIFKISNYQSSQNPELSLKNKSPGDTKGSYEAIIDNLYNLRGYKNSGKSKKTYEKSQLYQRMRDKILKKKKNFHQMPSSFAKVTEQDQSFRSGRKESADLSSSPVFVRRKWSVTVSFEDQQQQPTEEELKYLVQSLREFEEAKLQINPDLVVDQRSKMLQTNVDQ